MNTAELTRRINNITAVGTVSESKSVDGQALARVKIGEITHDFFPMLQQSSSFKRSVKPIRVGEQVVVLFPQGEGDFGVILGSIFNKGCKEPTGYSDTKEVAEFEDGTIISYDTATKTLEVDAVENVVVSCKNANITADTINITATTSHTGDMTINGKLSVSDGISTGGTITDSRGDLTNFSTTDGAVRA